MTEANNTASSGPARETAETTTLSVPSTASDRFVNLRSLGRVAIAILLYLMLIDAAIETFRSGPSIRWFVMATVAAYAVATILVWRRFDWATKGTASFGLLLFLLAATAWLPGGTDEGIVLVGQPTSAAPSLLTALAVLLAGISLIQPKFVSRPAKWAIGFLAVYGIAAFSYGIAARTPYSDLLHGESLWSRLPLWLQGAFIGALVLAPVGLLSRIVASWPGIRGTNARDKGMQLMVLTAAVVMAIGAFRAPASAVRNQSQFEVRGSASRLDHLVFARGESGGQPVGRADRFEEGVKAVYAFIRFEGLRAEDTVHAAWYQGADQLSEENVKLAEAFGASPPKKGSLRFEIKFPDGARPGGYFLEVSVNDHLALAGAFGVKPK